MYGVSNSMCASVGNANVGRPAVWSHQRDERTKQKTSMAPKNPQNRNLKTPKVPSKT